MILNCVDFQYIDGLGKLNKLLTRTRMMLLRLSGANIGLNSIIRPGALIVDTRKLRVGTNSIVGKKSVFMNFEPVTIGDDVEIGPNCVFQTNEHVIRDFDKPLGKQGAKYCQILVGSNCYLGSDVTLLSGVEVGDNVLIGAKSLVNKSLLGRAFYAGVPAKRKRSFTNV